MGTVSPYVIRLAATQLSTVGSTAGTLYAVSTCGSIFGTLLTAFYLIPLMGVSNIIHFLGMILVCLSLVVVPLVKLRGIELARAVTTLSVIVGSIMMPWTPALWARTKTLLEKDTFYHRIRIEEDDEARYMYFDRTLQSAMGCQLWRSLAALEMATRLSIRLAWMLSPFFPRDQCPYPMQWRTRRS